MELQEASWHQPAELPRKGHQKYTEPPAFYQEKRKLRHATVYRNPESIPPSPEPAIESPQFCHAPAIKARIQTAPTQFPTIVFVPSCRTTYLVALSEHFLSRQYCR